MSIRSEELFERLLGEINEGNEEYKKGEYNELASELGDVFWSIFCF